MNLPSRILSPIILVAILGSPGRAAEVDKPRLLVLIVFDQLRADYLERWQSLFVDGGFARLQREGAWFTDCHYPYATTTTGPGHASLLTGCTPARHGIVNNEWYDVKTSTAVNCAQSARYQRVPALIKKTIDSVQTQRNEEKTDNSSPAKKKLIYSGSPDYLLAPTFGDALKETTAGKARVVSLSFKNRSAILPAGKSGDAVYWLDSEDGMIVTSSFYRDSVHPWVAELNERRIADQWFDREWNRLLPDLDYARYSGPDDVTGEGKGVKQGVTFPHPTNGGLKKVGKSYYDALFNSPFGNEFLVELARRAVVAERLGKHEVPDLLIVSFSSNDAIGHCWGPDSQEVLDVTLRSDRLLADFMTFLDQQVGKDKFMVILSADHGVCPLPEVSEKASKFAKRISAKKIIDAAEEHLREKFPTEKQIEQSKVRWFESVQIPWIYLNQNLIRSRGLESADVERALASFLEKQEGIYRAFTRSDLSTTFAVNDPIGARMKQSYFAERCGDVGVVSRPYCLLGGLQTGTNHGSPHAYDTHVPLLIYFKPAIKPGIKKDPVTPQAAAAIFSKAINIKPPKMASYPVPERLFISD